jgi:hypothetical protein
VFSARRIAGRVRIALQLAPTIVLLTRASLMLESVWRITSWGWWSA